MTNFRKTVKYKCKNCNKLFVPRHPLNKVYCSPKCSKQYRNKVFYQGYKIRHYDRLYRHWLEEWRINTLKKYNYACRICGSKKSVYVHHIIPKEFGGKNNSKNLIVLCKIHHNKLHRLIRKKMIELSKPHLNFHQIVKNYLLRNGRKV